MAVLKRYDGTNWVTIGGKNILNNDNLVNGSTTGSIRGIYTRVEGLTPASSTEYIIGAYAFAQGYDTRAFGECSHVEGGWTTATGDYSHAEGSYTYAAGNFQHVEGKYNKLDNGGNYIHIAGNGTSSARSNAYTLDWSGNGVFAGTITYNEDQQIKNVATLEYEVVDTW